MALTVQQQQLVEQRLSNESRSVLIAYILWFFLGSFSAHRFYLGRIGSAVGMMLLFWIGTVTTAILIGWVLLLVYGIWWLVDAFIIPGMVDTHRQAKRLQISNEIAATSQT